MKTAIKKYAPCIVGIVWGIVCWAFFQFCYSYHFFYQEQNQIFLLSSDYVLSYLPEAGWLARLVGDFLTQFYYYLYVGPVILTGCLLVLGVFLQCLLHRWGVRKWIALLVAILVMTLFAVFCFHHNYRLSNIISATGLAGTFLLATTLWKKRNWLRILFAFVIAIIGCYLFGKPEMGKLQQPNFFVEKQLAVDNEYYFRNYDKVISMVENDPHPTQEMKFFYNLVRAQQGQLPDYLMQFDNNELGTFYKIGPETPLFTIKSMNELYWVLGDMTFTERAAMMSNVFSPQNRNVRMIRRLAECNIVSQDTLAANKYLRILDKTLVYRSWANNIRKHGQTIYKEKMQLVNHHDTITVSDNAHFLMMQLLDTNPDNTIALDYILCSNLLLKDIENFKRDYDRYCIDTGKPRLNTLYQEALCIWLAGTDAPQEEWEKYIQRADVFQQFQQYNEERGHPRFKGTYWYYFDKSKAPKV